MSTSLILDESVFEDEYCPEQLVGRTNEIKELKRCIEPAKIGRSIRNVLVFGPPGVGKTLVCRSILSEHFPHNYVYVNCWSKRTSHKVMEQIVLQSGLIVHGRESYSELVEKFEKLKKKIIVCLDEVDHLKDNDLLYVLARNSCGMVLIAKNGSVLTRMDDRISSSLLLKDIEFTPYSRDEIMHILQARAAAGVKEEAISSDLISIIADALNGDVRIALQTLRVAAKEAESKELVAITQDEINSAIKSTKNYRLPFLFDKLNEHQKAIFKILKKKGYMPSGMLYEEYCKSTREPVVDRWYRKQMNSLEALGLVQSSGTGRSKKYRSTV